MYHQCLLFREPVFGTTTVDETFGGTFVAVTAEGGTGRELEGMGRSFGGGMPMSVSVLWLIVTLTTKQLQFTELFPIFRIFLAFHQNMPILHIVAIKTKPGTTDERMQQLFDDLRLDQRVPHLLYDWVCS